MEKPPAKTSYSSPRRRAPRFTRVLLIFVASLFAGYVVSAQEAGDAGSLYIWLITTLAILILFLPLFFQGRQTRYSHRPVYTLSRYFRKKLLSNPLLWIGAFIPLLIHLSALAHTHFPSIPLIDLHLDLPAFKPPWNTLPAYMTQCRVYFAAVGLGCLLPSEIAFSLWFFPLLNGFFTPSLSRPIPSRAEAQSLHIVICFLTAALLLARAFWPPFPLHPLGLILMNTSLLQTLWLSIAIGWAIRLLLLRTGGTGVCRRARPFFLGLILGETLSMGILTVSELLAHGAVKYSLVP